ncbi:MAG: hypothetical protein KAJ95_04070 [Gammaproteobacteria bacterium]|nr:hypothetical protein [Gammaproteobacteria bacterium]
MNYIRWFLKGIKRRILSEALPAYELIEIFVNLQGEEVRKLHFAKETRVETIRLSISLLSDAYPQHVQLFNAEHLLRDDELLTDLSVSGEGQIEVTVIISRFKTADGMFWINESFNPFSDMTFSDHVREQSSWYYQQDEIDSPVRRNQIKSIINNLDLEGRAVVIMAFNSGFSSLFINWVRSCELNKLVVRERAIIFAMDEESKDIAENEGFHVCYDKNSRVLSEIGQSERYGDGEFKKHMFFQNSIIRDMLAMDCEFLFQDVDLVWRASPFEYFENNESQDIEFMYDGHNPRHGPLCANTGFMYFRPHQSTISFWEIIYHNYDRVIQYSSQQQPLNKYLGVLQNKALNINILPQDIFSNGHLFGPDPEKNYLTEKAKVIHCSWTLNLEQKLRKYKNNKLWFVTDDAGSGD